MRRSPGSNPATRLLKPRIQVIAGESAFGSRARSGAGAAREIPRPSHCQCLEPLVKLEEGEGLAGTSTRHRLPAGREPGRPAARSGGPRNQKPLTGRARKSSRQLGVRFGAFNIFLPPLLKPAATELRLLLWGLERARTASSISQTLPEPPGQGLTSALFDRSTPRGFYGVCGYRICGPRVVRIDMLERLADIIRDRVFWRPRFPEEAAPARLGRRRRLYRRRPT